MRRGGSPVRERERERERVIVVGGGLAGLAAGVQLAATHDVTVIEAEPEPGGQLAGGWSGGLPCDLGVHGIYPRYRELRALMARAGVGEDTLLDARTQHVITPAGHASP